jgi:hypothetical protein
MYGPGYPSGPVVTAPNGGVAAGGDSWFRRSPEVGKVPKSKVRKSVAESAAASSTRSNETSAAAARAHIAAPSGPVYLSIMLGLMVLGLVWLIAYYLLSSKVAFFGDLGGWNFAIGFALIIGGLLMTMRWR